jgi:alkylation response protein AidB-like acyl-CoA dehydrogenase
MDDELRRQILSSVDRLIAERIEPRAAEIDRTEGFPQDLYQEAAELGLFALCLPEAYGGLGGGTRIQLEVIERIARASPAFALAVATCPDSVLPILIAGSEDLHQEILPKVATGEWKPCYALSEPEAGSDAGAIRTRARREGDEYVLDGAKCWCTNGSVGNVYTVFAKTDERAGNRGISAFVVERGTPGFEIGADEPLIGLRGTPATHLYFDSVRVPVSRRLGEEGEGFRIAMTGLDESRLNAAAMSLGIAHRALSLAIRYAGERRAFGRPIGEHQGVQFLLAELATEYSAARALWAQAIGVLEAGRTRRASVYAAMAKNACTGIGMRMATEAIQIYGGAGLSRRNPLERLMRDAKAFQIFDGTTQIQNIVIGRYLQREGIPA